MPVVPLGLLRGCLALLGLFFAHVLGRSVAKAARRDPKPRVAGWAIRTILVLAAVTWRAGLDTVTIVAWLVAVLGFVSGYVLEKRPRHREDLTDFIFPGEN